MGKAAIKGPDECGPIVDFVGAFLDVFRRKVVDLEAYLPVTSCQNQTLEHLWNGSKGKGRCFCESKLRKWSLFTLLPIH